MRAKAALAAVKNEKTMADLVRTLCSKKSPEVNAATLFRHSGMLLAEILCLSQRFTTNS
jgi:hypothetical protein